MKRLSSCALLLCAASAVTADLSSNILGYWSFNGNVDNTAVPTKPFAPSAGYTPEFADSFHGFYQALRMDGVAGHSLCMSPGFASASTGNLPFTVSFWAKADADIAPKTWLWTIGQSQNRDFYFTTGQNFTMDAGVYGGNNHNVLSSSTVDWTRWRHVVVANTGGYMSEYRVYVDGALESSATTNWFWLYEDSFCLGRTDGTAEPPFKGLIDDMWLFNRKLNGDEVRALFNYAPREWRFTQGLDVHLSFDRNLGDSSLVHTHSAVTQTCSNAAVVSTSNTVDCPVGSGCLVVNQSSCGLEVSGASSFISTGSSRPFSASFWIKPMVAAPADGASYGILKIGSGITVSADYSTSTGYALAVTRAAGTSSTTTHIKETVTGWAHVAIAMANGLLLFYVNGINVATVAFPNPEPVSNTLTLFPNTLPSGSLVGAMDDFFFFSRYVFPDEFLAMYYRGSPESRLRLQNTLRYEFEDNGLDTTGFPGMTDISEGVWYWGFTAGARGRAYQKQCTFGTCINSFKPTGNPAHPAGGDFTYASWIRPSQDGKDQWNAAFGGVDNGVFIHIVKSDLSQLIGAFNSVSITVPSSVLAGNGWTHVAATYSLAAKLMNVYINGKFHAQLPNVDFSAITSYLRLSWPLNYGRTDGSITGSIDDVFLFSRALPEGDVWELARRGPVEAKYLTGKWGFESTLDDSATGQHALSMMIPTGNVSYQPGMYGNALYMDGNTRYAALNPTTLMGTGASPFTISFWMLEGQPMPTRTWLALVGGHSRGSLHVLPLNHALQIGTYVGDGQFWEQSSVATPTRWVHLLISTDGTTEWLYVDGRLRSRYAVASDLKSSSLTFGDHIDMENPYRGLLDEVTFHTRTVTGTEAESLYAASAQTAARVNVGLTAQWHLDGDGSDSSVLNVPLGVPSNQQWIVGPKGKALATTAGSPIDSASPISVSTTNPSLSFAAWFRFSAAITGQIHPISIRTNRSQTDRYFDMSVGPNGDVAVTASKGSAGFVRFTAPTNKWVHIAATYNSFTGALRLYANGVLVDETVMFNSVLTAGSFVTINTDGAIDEVNVWERELFGDEVVATYRDFCNTPGHYVPAGVSATNGVCEEHRCAEGFVDHDSDVSTPCVPCSAGEMTGAQQIKCDKCLPGSFSTVPRATCTQCAAGTFSNETGRTTACNETCNSGEWSYQGSTSCKSCVFGDCTECTTAGICTKCTGTLVPFGNGMGCYDPTKPPVVISSSHGNEETKGHTSSQGHTEDLGHQSSSYVRTAASISSHKGTPGPTTNPSHQNTDISGCPASAFPIVAVLMAAMAMQL